MAKPLFEDVVDEIFVKAGVKREGNEEWYQQCNQILHAKMATLSICMGLSMERVALFDKQKDALVIDLINLKKEGLIK